MRFTTMDPMCEKYYHLSPYAYCGNNPVNAVDLNGDTITIDTGKLQLRYFDGKLFNSDGSIYTGRIRGYLKQVSNALSSLNKTKEGKSLISELQNSNNMFTIKKGKNNFIPYSASKASANLAEIQKVSGNTIGSTGSGGIIHWNNSTSGGISTVGSTYRPAYIGLGHEMAHASDSNQGLLYLPHDYYNHITGTSYSSSFKGLLKSEWRATYRENLIRKEAEIPLREYYSYSLLNGIATGLLPRLLDANNNPINY